MTKSLTDPYRGVLEFAYSMYGTHGKFTSKDIGGDDGCMNALRSKGYIKRGKDRKWRVTDDGEDYLRTYVLNRKEKPKTDNDWEAREAVQSAVY
jgi:hypothetical protein